MATKTTNKRQKLGVISKKPQLQRRVRTESLI